MLNQRARRDLAGGIANASRLALEPCAMNPAPRKTAEQWFAEYGDSHQDHTNELIHWVCVPVIFCCVLGFISRLPIPEAWLAAMPWFDWSFVAIAAAFLFYVRLSPALSIGMLCFMAMCTSIIAIIELWSPWPAWRIYAAAFAVAWIGQFIGHEIEGKKPSFFRDLFFLLIGPAWLMSFVYRKAGQKY
jgi:uncharacterized membrane protein YGL010W